MTVLGIDWTPDPALGLTDARVESADGVRFGPGGSVGLAVRVIGQDAGGRTRAKLVGPIPAHDRRSHGFALRLCRVLDSPGGYYHVPDGTRIPATVWKGA